MYKFNEFSHRHFNSHQRNRVWRSINSDEDIKIIFSDCHNLVTDERLIAHKLDREDIDKMEMELGKCEIALNRMAVLKIAHDKMDDYITKYHDMSKQVADIALRRVSWN